MGAFSLPLSFFLSFFFVCASVCLFIYLLRSVYDSHSIYNCHYHSFYATILCLSAYAVNSVCYCLSNHLFNIFFTSYTTLCIYKSLNFCLFITLSNLLRARICYTHKFTYRNIHRHTYFASVCVCTRVCADMHIHAHAHTWEYTHRSFSVCL